MAVFADRVQETTTVTGTGTATLLGAVAGYQAFSVVGNSASVYYTIVNSADNTWEVGSGVYSTTGPTLTRATILASSNGGAAVSFAAGTKNIWLDAPASFLALAAVNDSSGTVRLSNLGNYVTAQGSTLGSNSATLSAAGADTNISLYLNPKGTGALTLAGNNIALNSASAILADPAGAANATLSINPASGGNGLWLQSSSGTPTISATNGTNVSLNLVSRGTGTIQANGTPILTANQTITLSGDLTGSGSTAITGTLLTVNSNVGQFLNTTVNGKGLVTAATNQVKVYNNLMNTVTIASGVVTFDLSAANAFFVSLTANVTSVVFSNVPVSGSRVEVVVKYVQDATGGRTVAAPTGALHAGGTAYVPTTAANAIDEVCYVSDNGGSQWRISYAKGFA